MQRNRKTLPNLEFYWKEREDILRSLLSKGFVPDTELAAHFECSVSGISKLSAKIKHELGVTAKGKYDSDREQRHAIIHAELLIRTPVEQIAAKLGRSVSFTAAEIALVRNAHEIPHYSEWEMYESERALIANLYEGKEHAERLLIAEIAEKTNLCYSVARRLHNEYWESRDIVTPTMADKQQARKERIEACYLHLVENMPERWVSLEECKEKFGILSEDFPEIRRQAKEEINHNFVTAAQTNPVYKALEQELLSPPNPQDFGEGETYEEKAARHGVSYMTIMRYVIDLKEKHNIPFKFTGRWEEGLAELHRFVKEQGRPPHPNEIRLHRDQGAYMFPAQETILKKQGKETYIEAMESLGFSTKNLNKHAQYLLVVKVRELGIPYKKEIRVNKKKPYRVDFLISGCVLEVDGPTHYSFSHPYTNYIARKVEKGPKELYRAKRARDREVNADAIKLGYSVLRIEHSLFLRMRPEELKEAIQSAPKMKVTILGYTHEEIPSDLTCQI